MFSCLYAVFGYFDNMSSPRRHHPGTAFVYPSTVAGSRAAPLDQPLAKAAARKAPFPICLPHPGWNEFMQTSPTWHLPAASSAREGEVDPAPPRGREAMQQDGTYVDLHVYRANGDFLVEEMVPLDGWIEAFLNRLDETGLVPVPPLIPIDPSEEMDEPGNGDGGLFVAWSGQTWKMPPDGYVDELVWDNMVLYWNRTFGSYVDNYGMSVSEPVHVTLVRTSARTLYAASKDSTYPF